MKLRGKEKGIWRGKDLAEADVRHAVELEHARGVHDTLVLLAEDDDDVDEPAVEGEQEKCDRPLTLLVMPEAHDHSGGDGDYEMVVKAGEPRRDEPLPAEGIEEHVLREEELYHDPNSHGDARD